MKKGHGYPMIVFYYVFLPAVTAAAVWGLTYVGLRGLREFHRQEVKAQVADLLQEAVAWSVENRTDLLEAAEGTVLQPSFDVPEGIRYSCMVIALEKASDQSRFLIRVEGILGNTIWTEKSILTLSHNEPLVAREELKHKPS